MPRKAEKREKSHTKSLLIYGSLTGFLSDWKAFKCKQVNIRSLVLTRGEHVWLERILSCR
ncbi:hypothetical protein DX887_17595 [Vibrio alginolyticus]|nr:hypothetical protein [Vibrio alginolyticus]